MNEDSQFGNAENSSSETQPKKKRRKVSPKLVVRVTDELIDTAVPKDSEHCMIADAIKAAFPSAKSIAVDLATCRFSDPDKGLRYIYLTPRFAQAALVDFDEGRRPQAFQFELTRAAQIITMYKRKGTKDVPLTKLGRKYMQAEKGGCVPTIIGGKALPVMLEPDTHSAPHADKDLRPLDEGSAQRADEESSSIKPLRNGRKRRRREFGLRAFKSGVDVLISGHAG